MKQFRLLFAVLSLALGAAVMASCSSDDDKEVIVPQKESKPLSLAEFNKIALGYGWVEAETHEILDNGEVDTKDFYEGREGDKPKSYEFRNDTATTFVYLEKTRVNAFYDRKLHYDETTGKVYFDDIERFKVLSADEQEIIVDKLYAVRENELGYHKDIYHRVRLTKMTANELQATKRSYWINGDDIERDLTTEDICHKWVLQKAYGYPWNPSENIYEQRSDNTHYIRFLPNGTIEGHSDNIDFRGTYKLSGEVYHVHNGIHHVIAISITPDENGGEWPEMFENLPDVEDLNLQYGAYYLSLGGGYVGYLFIRAIED